MTDIFKTRSWKRTAMIVAPAVVVLMCVVFIWIFSAKSSPDVKTNNYESQLSKADNEYLYNRAREYYKKEQLDSALIHLTVIAKRGNDNASDEQKEISADAFNDCGMIYFMMRNYPKAYNCFNQAIVLGSDRIKTLARNNLAALYYCFNDKEHACELLEEAAAGSLKTGEKDVLLSASLNLTIPYFESGNKKSLEESLQRLEQSDIPEDDPKKHYVKTVIEGYIALLNNRPDSALQIFHSLDTDNLNSGDKATVDNFGNIYRAYFSKGDYVSALKMADKMMQTPQGTPLSSEREMTAAQMRAECYAALGNSAEESKAQRRYYELKDSLFSVKQYGEILNLNSAYEMDKAEQRLQESNYHNRMQKRYLLFAAILIVVIVIAYIRIYMQRRRLREMMQTLYEKASAKVMNKPLPKDAPLPAEGEYMDENESGLSEEDGTDAKVAPVRDDDNALKELSASILNVMENDKPWLSRDFSQRLLASMVGSNMTYVSQAINRIIGKSFSVFVNEYRINEACRRFADPDYFGNLTIEAVGASVGFTSRSGFNAAFKKITGLSPKDYISMARGK